MLFGSTAVGTHHEAEDPDAIAVAVASIGDPQIGGRHGCRFGHAVFAGFAIIQIRGGAERPKGRDERVSFMMDADALDDLIAGLTAIRSELRANQLQEPMQCNQ